MGTTNYTFGSSGFGAGPYGGFTGTWPTRPVSYYLNLFTSEYQLSANLLAWATAPLGSLDDLTNCLVGFNNGFDLSYAVGPALDILGVIVGQPRTVGFQPSAGVSPVLTDTTYRLLLQARIAQNQWTGTIDSLQPLWQSLFPGGRIVIQDNQNMTATIILSGAFSSITQDLITNGYIVPRPEGVLYNYVFSTLPIFGFDQSNSYIAGFDQGHWS